MIRQLTTHPRQVLCHSVEKTKYVNLLFLLTKRLKNCCLSTISRNKVERTLKINILLNSTFKTEQDENNNGDIVTLLQKLFILG